MQLSSHFCGEYPYVRKLDKGNVLLVFRESGVPNRPIFELDVAYEAKKNNTPINVYYVAKYRYPLVDALVTTVFPDKTKRSTVKSREDISSLGEIVSLWRLVK